MRKNVEKTRNKEPPNEMFNQENIIYNYQKIYFFRTISWGAKCILPLETIFFFWEENVQK